MTREGEVPGMSNTLSAIMLSPDSSFSSKPEYFVKSYLSILCACVFFEVVLSTKISVPSISICVTGYFSKLFGKYFLTNFCEG